MFINQIVKYFPILVLATFSKMGFFQNVEESVLLYRCTTWTLTKKLDENQAKMM